MVRLHWLLWRPLFVVFVEFFDLDIFKIFLERHPLQHSSFQKNGRYCSYRLGPMTLKRAQSASHQCRRFFVRVLLKEKPRNHHLPVLRQQLQAPFHVVDENYRVFECMCRITADMRSKEFFSQQ